MFLQPFAFIVSFQRQFLFKDIKAETVAEGMTTIYCRTGIPKQILTDQGTQFVGYIVQQLSKKLGVHHMKTAPYHPQTNGCLVWWHGTFAPMIKKYLENKLDWPNQLKFALFASRSAQNRNTGYSRFEIVYGRLVRGPLELLKEEWESPNKKVVSVCV